MKPLICVVVMAFFVFGFSLNAAGQEKAPDREAEALSIPEVTIPAEAVATGLGGKVDVRVRIDNTGKVIGIEGTTGPDSVCPSVSRIDVLALRAEAERAALETRFSPEIADGTPIESNAIVTIIFNTPELKDELPFKVRGDINSSPQMPGVSAKTEGSSQGASSTYNGPLFTIKDPTEKSGDSNTPPNPASNAPIEAASVDEAGIANGSVLNGRAIRLAKPPYPPAARTVRASGAVTIQVLILEDGTVFSAQAISGHPLLRSASRAAACESTFRPVTFAGQPVKVSGVITYNFVP